MVNRTLEIHTWLFALLLVGVLTLFALFLIMMHVHSGDVSYIARTHRPIIIIAPGRLPPVLSS
jgi:hypothetical protein